MSQSEGGEKKSEPETKKVKNKPKNIVIPPKKPKLSKAERRALQEAQRAAKGQKKNGSDAQKKKKQQAGDAGAKDSKGDEKKEVAPAQEEEKKSDKVDTHPFFSHLPPFKDPKLNKDFSGFKPVASASSNLHPAVLSLGLQYADGSIRGANSRCKAMLKTFQEVISDYTFPPGIKDFRQDLENRVLKPAFTYWTTKCRIHSVTMGNAFTFLKLAVANLDRDLKLEEVKNILSDSIEAYTEERIEFADKAICKHASSKIMEGDVILTYARNDLIQMLLLNQEKKFRVILVDSRPLLEGKDMLKKLIDAGIECTFVLLNSLSYVMKEVTKVFLGASALMSNGSILSRVGTASVAMMARSYNVPVLVCCETYKISSRVQLESITGNELGNPEGLSSASSSLKEYQAPHGQNLRLLNLLYDLTPTEFVSGIVTEMGILPPTSVAVLLREMNPQDSGFKADDIS